APNVAVTEVMRNTTESRTPHRAEIASCCLSGGRCAAERVAPSRSSGESTPEPVRSETRLVTVVRETPRARERSARCAGPTATRCPSRRRAVAPGLVLISSMVVPEEPKVALYATGAAACGTIGAQSVLLRNRSGGEGDC